MAPASRRHAAPLSELLFEEGWRFEFFQAVRLLQLQERERTPVGAGDDPRREGVRFRSDVSLGFPASDLRGIEAPAEGTPARVTVAFLGVATPASFGSLPQPYAELVLARGREKDQALRDFLDLFNHRLISLFYRAWEKYRFAVAYERDGERGATPYEHALLALLGLGTPALRERLPLPDRALLARAGALCRGSAPALALADLLADFFAVPVAVRQFVPGWYVVEEEQRSRLGRTACELGTSLTLGERVQVAQTRFRLRLGPLAWGRFQEFLPTGAAFGPLVSLTRLAAGPEHDFDLQLALAVADVPRLRLAAPAQGGAAWLGWSTWLHAAPLAEAPADVIVDVAAGELVIAGADAEETFAA